MERELRLVVFEGLTVNGTGYQESMPIDLRWVRRAEAGQIRVASVIATAHCKLEYATSPTSDSGNFTDFDLYPDLMASNTSSFVDASGVARNSEGWNVIAMPNPLAPFIKLRVTGHGSNPLNPTDTLCDLHLWVREG